MNDWWFYAMSVFCAIFILHGTNDLFNLFGPPHLLQTARGCQIPILPWVPGVCWVKETYRLDTALLIYNRLQGIFYNMPICRQAWTYQSLALITESWRIGEGAESHSGQLLWSQRRYPLLFTLFSKLLTPVGFVCMRA